MTTAHIDLSLEPREQEDYYFGVLHCLLEEDRGGIERALAAIDDNCRWYGVMPSALLHPHLDLRKVALFAERAGLKHVFAYLAKKALELVVISEPHDDMKEQYECFFGTFNRERRTPLEDLAKGAPATPPITMEMFGKRVPYDERGFVKHWKTYRYATYFGDLKPNGEAA